MEDREQQIKSCCKRITPLIKQLIEEFEFLRNTPEDVEAYSIIGSIHLLASLMREAENAGTDEDGVDVLDAEESVANAIRAAKELI